MAGIISWLRSVAAPWFGSWTVGRAREELSQERARVRISGMAQQIKFLPFVDMHTGETSAMRRSYPLMLAKEPAIKAALLDKIFSVAALDMVVNAGGEGNPRDKEAADFGSYLMTKIVGGDYGLTGLPAFVETVILPGLIFGFAVAEKTWVPETRGKWAGKVLLKLKSKDTENHLTLQLDEFNNVTSVVGLGPNAGLRWAPENFVIWKHLSIFDNPAGLSDLRSSYRAFWLIDTAWKLRAIFLEKFSAGPMLKGTYNDPGPQKTQLEESLDAARAATWMSIPEGAKVEAMDLAMRGTADFESAIKDLKQEIFIGISGAMLQAMEGSTRGGRGDSSVHKDTADIRKWHVRTCSESVINSQIIPDAIDLNFTGVAYSEVSLGGIDDAEMQESLNIDIGLARDLRMKLSRKDLYKRYGRPEPLDAADILEPPDKPQVIPGGQFGEKLAESSPEAAKIAGAVATRWQSITERYGADAAAAVIRASADLLGEPAVLDSAATPSA